MLTKEELLKCFQTEITAISEAEIAAAQREVQEIQDRAQQEIHENAQAAAQLWLEQETEDLQASHAVAMSHLNDENHKRLMAERAVMVEALFDEAKQQLLQFHREPQYQELLRKKLTAYAQSEEAMILQLGNTDKALMKELSAILKNAQVELANDIHLGGFRLILKQQNKLIDETLDSALSEARKAFLKHSALTIN